MKKQNNEKIFLYGLLAAAIAVLLFNLSSFLGFQNVSQDEERAGLTQFDIQLAKQFMDKNSKIGVLGSAHIHADFKVYIDGRAVDFADPKYYMKSSFIHLDESENKEEASGVLHMHATGVPLWIFFESIGGKFNETCLALPQEFCNNENKSLKFYVNGVPNSEFGNYIFKNSDTILISYGDAKEDIQSQLESITNFS